MKYKYLYFGISLLLMLPGLVVFLISGLRLGIDFSGGTVLSYKFEKMVDINTVREVARQANIELATVTPFNEQSIQVKAKPLAEAKVTEFKDALVARFGPAEELRNETVSPTISAEITKNAILAVLLAAMMIVIYLAISFRKIPRPASPWRFGITAVLALLHDVVILIGVFAILGKYYHVEVDVLFVTATLTVIGFSVHDTIVVFDRIRENLPKHLSKKFIDVANFSVAQTLARSLSTSLTVVFVLVALLLFGGESIRWFVVALLVGIISGTYSSIFNATALLVFWEEKLGH